MGSGPGRVVWAVVRDLRPALSRWQQRWSTAWGSRVVVRNSLGRSERATVITDVVIILPMLLIMVAGILMLGTRISDRMYLSQSARELGVILSKVPYMYELALVGEESRTFQITLGPVDESGKTSAEACIRDVADPDYRGCSPDAPHTCCAHKIAQWYASEFMRMKQLLVDWPVTVQVGYGARDTSSGLCFVDVTVTGRYTRWSLLGRGQVRAEAHVPYLSTPVAWNNGACFQLP
jgi:hypothetical protein